MHSAAIRVRIRVYGLATVFGSIVWLLDALMDRFFFYEGTMMELLITDVPAHEVYIRTLILVSFLVFAEVISRIIVKLNKNQYFLKTIMSMIPLPVFYKDTEGRYLGVNRAFLEYVGIEREAIIGKSVYELYEADLAQTYHEADLELLKAGGTQSYEAHVRRYDGSLRDVVFEKSVFKDINGKVDGIIGTVIDLTEEKQIRQNLIEAKEAAESANQAKSEFFAVVSHELRTPLNPIIGFSNLLLESCETQLEREYIENIIGSANKQRQLIEQLLNYSEISKGNLPASLEEFSLVELCNYYVANYELHPKKLTLEFINGDLFDAVSEDLVVLGPKGMLEQVLGNLLDNAFKYTEAGQVSLKMGMEQMKGRHPRFHFSIMDTGVGIEVHHFESIFEAFRQVESSQTRNHEGLGLGLAMSKKIVETLGGEIGVQSKVGVGSTFWFNLSMPVALEGQDFRGNGGDLVPTVEAEVVAAASV